MEGGLLGGGDQPVRVVGLATASATSGAARGCDARGCGRGWCRGVLSAFAVPEVRRSLVVCALLTCATACQLVADTLISRFVGKLGSDLSAARGEVATILGFAFYACGFLTDGFTARVAAAAGSGDRAAVGAWVKTALLAGAGAGVLTLLAFGPTYRLWLRTFGEDEDSPTWSAVLVLYFVRLAGITPNLIYNAVVGVLQGLQQPGYIVVNNVALAGLDIVGNYVLLFPLGMSVAGSPIAINVAFLASLAFALAYLAVYRPLRLLFTLTPWRRMLPRAELLSFARDCFSLMCRSFLVELSAYLLPVAAKQLGQPQLVAYTTVVTELAKYSYYLPLGLGTAANMLGSFHRGRGDLPAFRRVLTGLPLLGLMLSMVFMAVFVAAGPWVWAPFFLDEGESAYAEEAAQLRLVWPLLVVQQAANVLLATYEGCMYAAGAFTFVRNVVVSGFLLLFAPLLAAGVFAPATRSLFTLMAAKLAYDAYRAAWYVWMVHARLQRVQGGREMPATGSPFAADAGVGEGGVDGDGGESGGDEGEGEGDVSAAAKPLLAPWRKAASASRPASVGAGGLLAPAAVRRAFDGGSDTPPDGTTPSSAASSVSLNASPTAEATGDAATQAPLPLPERSAAGNDVSISHGRILGISRAASRTLAAAPLASAGRSLGVALSGALDALGDAMAGGEAVPEPAPLRIEAERMAGGLRAAASSAELQLLPLAPSR